MRKSVLVLPALAALVLTGCGGGGGHAGAPTSGASTGTPTSPAVSPTTTSPSVNSVSDTNATAGWDTKSPTAALTAVTGTFQLTTSSAVTHGALGLQLCNSHTGYAVQFGAVPASGGWLIGYFAGSLSAATGIGGDPCAGNQLLRSGTVTSLGSVPADATVKARISVRSGGEVVLTYAFSADTSFNHQITISNGTFDEAAAGASYVGVSFHGAVVNQVTSFSGVSATSANGTTGGFATWQPVLVSSSKTAGSPIQITASSLSPTTGSGTSSFDIVVATPKL